MTVDMPSEDAADLAVKKEDLAQTRSVIDVGSDAQLEEKTHEFILRQLSDDRLVFMLESMVEKENWKPIAAILDECVRRRSTVPDSLLDRFANAFPTGSGVLRGSLCRYFLTQGKGSLQIAREAMGMHNAASAIAVFLENSNSILSFEDGNVDEFLPYLVQNLHSPLVAQALCSSLNEKNAGVLKGTVTLLCTLLEERDDDREAFLGLIYWAACASMENQNALVSHIPVFLAMVNTHPKEAFRAICAILYKNQDACAMLRVAGLPYIGESGDADVIRLYEVLSISDQASHEEIRNTKLKTLMKMLESSDAEILATTLHVLSVVLEEDDTLSISVRDRSHDENWIANVTEAVKRHPFNEHIQQFGLELLTLLGTVDPECLIKSGGSLLAKVACGLYPNNTSLAASLRWLTEVAENDGLSRYT